MERARSYGYRVEVVDEMVRSVLPVKDFRTYNRLVRLFREIRPDVVHTHSSKAGNAARLFILPLPLQHLHDRLQRKTPPLQKPDLPRAVRRTHRNTTELSAPDRVEGLVFACL